MSKRKRNINLLILLCASGILFLFAWENIQATRLGYNIEFSRKEIKDLENENKYLKKEIQTSLSPEKIQQKAFKLGMVYPEPGEIVLLEKQQDRTNSGQGWFARIFKFQANKT